MVMVVVVVSGLTLIVSSIFGQDLNKVQTWWSFFWREREGETKKKKIKRPFQIPKDDEKKKHQTNWTTKRLLEKHFEKWFSTRGDSIRVTSLNHCSHEIVPRKNGEKWVRWLCPNRFFWYWLFNIKMSWTTDVTLHLREEKKRH